MDKKAIEKILEEERKMKNDFTVLIVNESTYNSIVSDIVSFSILLLGFFINYNYLGDSTLIKLLIAFLFFVGVLKYIGNKVKKMTPEEALKYLQEKIS